MTNIETNIETSEEKIEETSAAQKSGFTHSDLHHCFDDLVRSLAQLTESLRKEAEAGYPHWIPLTDLEARAGVQPIEKAIQLYLALFYQEGQESNQTRSCHGLIGASPETLALAQQVNDHKHLLQSTLQQIKKEHPKWAQQIPFDLPQRHPAYRQALQSQNLQRLHLKQSYRQIPLLFQYPDRVGFTWSLDGRSITKVSFKEAEQRLLKLGEEKPHIQAQLSKLRGLPKAQQNTLRKVQKLAPAMKANLVYRQPEQTVRKTINAPLPIIYPAQPHEALPKHKKLSTEIPTEHERLKREDTLLGDEPFLPSINLYLSQLT